MTLCKDVLMIYISPLRQLDLLVQT